MANTGKIAAFFGGQDGGLRLEQVCHSLNQDNVGTGFDCRTHLLCEQVVRFIEAHGAKRREQRPRRTDVGNHITRAGVAHARHGGRENLAHRSRIAELARVRAERVRGDREASRFDVLAMNSGHFVGAVQAQKLRKFARLQACRLQHGAHSAVENQVLLARNHACKIIISDAQRVTRIGENSMRSYR